MGRPDLLSVADDRDADASPEALLEATNASLELQLKEAREQLSHASRVQSDLLANVSHELRTPLTAILGFVEILVTGLDGQLNPRQLEDAMTIQANSRRLLKLVDDLIDIAAIGAERLDLRTESIDAGAAIGRAVAQTRPLAGQKGIALTFDPPPSRVMVEADPERLDEIILNLLTNAVKFTPSAGSVKVRLGGGAAEGSEQGMATIEVIDSGVGIAAADVERIFEPFERLAGPEVSGTGLGLAISRKLAQFQGGSLTVDSTPGLGSRFILSLPLTS